MQAIGAGSPGLSLAVAAEQHSSAWFAPARRQGSGQQFGLVIATTVRSATAGGRPGDDVDLGGIESTAELLGQVVGEAALVAELQADDEIFRQAHELRGGNDARRCCDGRGGHQGKTTTATQLGSGLAASGTTFHQHVPVVSRGCDSHHVITGGSPHDDLEHCRPGSTDRLSEHRPSPGRSPPLP